jgi:hypothetical protein
MGDMGDYWRDVAPAMQEESRQKRASNRRIVGQCFRCRHRLRAKNEGAHLIVRRTAHG